MSITANSGPYISYGQNTNPNSPSMTDYNPEAGPSLFYNGVALLDNRWPYSYEPGQNFGNVTAGLLAQNIQTLNVVPYTLSATAIAAAAATTASTAMTLVSSSSTTTGIATAVSINRADTGASVTGLLAIDGYTSVSGYVSNGTSGTAGNILVVSTASNGPLSVGMVISGTGITTGTYITGIGPVLNVTNGNPGTGGTGTYYLSTSQAAGTSGSPITITASIGTSTVPATTQSRQAFGSAGTVQLWNPQCLIARAVSVTPTSGTPTASITFTVAGYDIYGYPMTEVISLTTGSTQSTAVNGKKAFKYIASVTPSVTDTVTYSVGTTDIIGLPIVANNFGELVINYPATVVTATTGFTAAVGTYATSTTGDVRGTYALQTASNGSRRLMITQSPQTYNIAAPAGVFGVTQA